MLGKFMKTTKNVHHLVTKVIYINLLNNKNWFVKQMISYFMSFMNSPTDLKAGGGGGGGAGVRVCGNLTLLSQNYYIQVTPAMSTSRNSILSLMSKWFFIPNMFSLYIYAFQLRLCRKRLTWSNGYLEVIFHAQDVFSIICYFLCRSQKSALTRVSYYLFRLCTCITWGAKIFQTDIRNN